MDEEQDFEAETEEPQGIPRFEFTNARIGNGWAEFYDVETLSGKQVRDIRAAIKGGDGEAANGFYGAALTHLIARWEVPGKPTMPIPKGDKGKALDNVPGVFLAALERHIKPHLSFLKPDADEDGPGSP